MKKVLTIVLCMTIVALLSGCNMNNTPTKKVEEYLNSYKTLDDNVTKQISSVIDEDQTMSTDQKDKYKEVLKRQYKDLTYTIKDEMIDGDNATVTVEIEVYDFYKSNMESDKYYQENPDKFTNNESVLDELLLVDYRIKSLTDTSERVKYTIDFYLTKTDNNWTIDDLDSTTIQKIHGLYAH